MRAACLCDWSSGCGMFSLCLFSLEGSVDTIQYARKNKLTPKPNDLCSVRTVFAKNILLYLFIVMYSTV